MSRVNRVAAACTIGVLSFMTSARAEPQLPLDRYVLKATHNSYAARCDSDNGQRPPVMHHEPHVQVNDFGVWMVELDFSIVLEGSTPRAVVGHDGPNAYFDGSGNVQGNSHRYPTWRRYVDDYLRDIKDVQALQYRPVIVAFEKKGWGSYDSPTEWVPILEQAIASVFDLNREVFGPDALSRTGGTWPSVPELAGKLIPTAFGSGSGGFGGTSRIFLGPEPAGFSRDYFDGTCATLFEVQVSATAGANLLSPDVYQHDWSFYRPSQGGWSLPLGRRLITPNPVVVDLSSPDIQPVTDGVAGCDWRCGNEDYAWNDAVVSQQGTPRFPFDTVGEGVSSAEPGWTVVVRAGNYDETLTIDKPLVLRAEGGAVTIGR